MFYKFVCWHFHLRYNLQFFLNTRTYLTIFGVCIFPQFYHSIHTIVRHWNSLLCADVPLRNYSLTSVCVVLPMMWLTGFFSYGCTPTVTWVKCQLGIFSYVRVKGLKWCAQNCALLAGNYSLSQICHMLTTDWFNFCISAGIFSSVTAALYFIVVCFIIVSLFAGHFRFVVLLSAWLTAEVDSSFTSSARWTVIPSCVPVTIMCMPYHLPVSWSRSLWTKQTWGHRDHCCCFKVPLFRVPNVPFCIRQLVFATFLTPASFQKFSHICRPVDHASSYGYWMGMGNEIQSPRQSWCTLIMNVVWCRDKSSVLVYVLLPISKLELRNCSCECSLSRDSWRL